MDASIARLRRTTMRISPMGRILLWILPAFVLATAPAAAQHNAPDTRGRVYTLLGGGFGDGPFIATGAGAGIRLTPRLGLDLELVHLSGTGDADRAGGVSAYPVGIPESAIPLFSFDNFDRPRRDVTTFLTRIVVEFPVADGRLYPYLAGGGGVGRVTESFGGGAGLTRSVPAASIINEPPPGSGSDPGSEITETGYVFGGLPFPVFGGASQLGLALSLGGGVDVRLWRGLGVGVDVRWLRVLLNYDHVDTAQAGASVSYRF